MWFDDMTGSSTLGIHVIGLPHECVSSIFPFLINVTDWVLLEGLYKGVYYFLQHKQLELQKNCYYVQTTITERSN